MNNEFGFTYNEPFNEVYTDKQWYTIINIYDDNIELKINDVDVFNVFDNITKAGKLIETKTVYSVDSHFNAITTFNTNVKTSSYRAIPHTILTSSMYVKTNNRANGIVHFTEKTKIKKIYYYHKDLYDIFINPSMTIKRKFDPKDKYINIEAKKTKDVKLGTIKIKDNEIKVFLVNSFSTSGNIRNINIKPITYIRLEFKKYVDFNFSYKIKRRLDTVIHLLLFTDKRCITMEFVDTKKNSYIYNDLSKEIKDKTLTLTAFDIKDVNSIFIKLLEFLVNIEETNSNGFLPFFEFDKSKPSLEIQFLEYYRALEFIDTETRKKKGKGKNKLFLLDLLKKYPNLTNEYFKNKPIVEVEEEIRSLRNYYSHSGYYLDNLPIPTDNPKRYLKVDVQWKLDVRTFIKKIAYLEVYSVATIQVDENKFSSNVTF